MADINKRIANLSLEKQALLSAKLKAVQKSQVPPIVPVARGEHLPLSMGQHRLWFLEQLFPDSPLYNIPILFQLIGDLNYAAFQRSINEIVRRHEILRTSFATIDGQPHQVIAKELKLTLPIIDLRGHSSEEVDQRVSTEAQCPFNLAQWPLFRCQLFQLADNSTLVLLNFHHIVVDGWSILIFIDELATLYEAYSTGKPSPLADPTLQYADYSVWQKQWIESEQMQKHLSYWRKQLEGCSTMLELPTDRSRHQTQTFHGAKYQIKIPAQIYQGLKALSTNQGTTLFTILLAGFSVLLYRYTGQADLNIGTATANREKIEVAKIMGIFANTLVLRARLDGKASFLQFLDETKKVCLDGFAHQEIPFERMLEELQLKRDLSHSLLFQVLFILQDAPRENLNFGDLKLTEMPFVEMGSAKRDLSLFMSERKGDLNGVWEYNTDLFDEPTIERLTCHLINLLAAIVANPNTPIGDLEMLSTEERTKLLPNKEAIQYQDLFFHQLIEQQVQLKPTHLALISSDQRLTYQELNVRANRLAHYLRSKGVGNQSLIGICLERGLEMVVAMFAILKAGAAYLALDPGYPQERLIFMLEDGEVALLITDSLVLTKLAYQGRHIMVDEEATAIAAMPVNNLENSTKGEDLAYLIYTSGSTGRPKGVLVKQREYCKYLQTIGEQLKIFPEDIYLHTASLAFASSTRQLMMPLTRGISVVIAATDQILDPLQLFKLIKQEQVTIIDLVSSYWRICNKTLIKLDEQERNSLLANRLRMIVSSSEPLLPDIVYQWQREIKSGTRLLNTYGQTETAGTITIYEIPSISEEARSIPIGRPMPGREVYLLDQFMNLVPIGVVGELFIGGRFLAAGYLKRPELTAERFVYNPFSNDPADYLYRTGDTARYLVSGELEFLGRRDNQFKIRGFRVELQEIEMVLRQNPDILEAVVVANEEPLEERKLTAFLVGRSDAMIDTRKIREFLKQKLPDYMIPAYFVRLKSIPFTPTGKVDRRALPKSSTIPSEQPLQEGVSTPTEEVLAGIWKELLKTEQVNRSDNFFELGGHSLLATQIVSRVREAFQIELPLKHLFEQPTLARLAEEIELAIKVKDKVKDEVKDEYSLALPPIRPVAREGRLPLSFAQQRLWFLYQFAHSNTAYNIVNAVKLMGKLNIEALTASFNKLVARHEVLRTSFAEVDGEPQQVIISNSSLALTLVDLSSKAETERDREALDVINEQATRPFDISAWPLLRVTLLKLAEDEHVLLIVIHHIISDGWSMGILVSEIAACYQAFCQNKPSPLPALPIQYADFACWQQQWLNEEALANQIAFWKKQLHGLTTLQLPTDRPRPPALTFQGQQHHFQLDKALFDKVNRLCHKMTVTTSMVMMAAFKLLLARYSGQQDIAIGTPVAYRTRVEVEGLIGFFVNSLVLRTDLSGNASFKELLERVREVSLAAYANQDVSFEKLVECLEPARDMSRTPLFQVMFIMQNTPKATIQLPELVLTPYPLENQTAKFDLTLLMTETEGQLMALLEYNTNLWDGATIARMADHFQILLAAAVENADLTINELPLLTAKETEQILNTWNQTRVAYADQTVLSQFIESQALQIPEQIAIICQNNQITYQELNERANQLAHYLRSQGIGAETLVALCYPRSIEMVIAVLGILKAGGAYIPLDPTYPRDRLAYIIENAQPALVITEQNLADLFDDSNASRLLFLDSQWSTIAQQGRANVDNITQPANLAYVIYTSGSTGRPKGVQVTHSAVVNFLTSMSQSPGLKPADTLLSVTTLSFDIAAMEIFLPLIMGAKLVIARWEETIDGVALAALLERTGANVMQATPATWRMLLAAGWQGNRSLKMICGGEALPRELASQLLAVGDSLWNMYGPTETTIWSACGLVPAHLEKISIGAPIANTQLYILDDLDQLVPIGVAGQLHIGGVGLARGYFNEPALTADKFIPNAFSELPGERLYRTGDLVRRLADGSIEFLGRVDHQVKIRGFRIELGEIEARLREHTAIKEAVVVASEIVQDKGLDKGKDKRLVAYFISNEENGLTGQLRAFLKERLPEYMIPSAFVRLTEMPLTANGKIDRRALPALDQNSLQLIREYVAPRNPIENGIIDIWREILHLDKIGINDNFFELGGHSLLATQIFSRLRENFKIALPLRDIFEFPTIAGLAEQIEKIRQADNNLQYSPIVPISRAGDLPLSFSQQRLWFLDQLAPGQSAHNIKTAIRLQGQLNIDILHQSINEVIARHEILRTTFGISDGQPTQTIKSSLVLPLPVIDCQGAMIDNSEHEIARLAHEVANKGFTLAEGPLLRVALLKLGAAEHVLVLVMHHLISDIWSFNVFAREIAAIYGARSIGESALLPELPVQYVDFAHWQRQWLQGDILEEQLAYWEKTLANAAPLLELPTDRPRPEVQSHRGAIAQLTVPVAVREEVKQLSQRKGVTLFMTLLSAFNALLYRYSDQEDIVIGTPIWGRNQQVLEGLIGFFAYPIALRTQLSGNPTFSELIARVSEVTLGAYAHQDVPFEKVVEIVKPERNTGYSPLFQVMFSYLSDATADLALADLTFSTVKGEQDVAEFDLFLSITELAQGLELSLSYNIDLFDRETAENLLDSYLDILNQVISDAEKTIQQLTISQLLAIKVDTARTLRKKEVFAIASTFTAEPLAPALAFWLKELGLAAQIEFAAYNQVFQQLLDPTSLLAQNRGTNIVLIRYEDLQRFKNAEQDRNSYTVDIKEHIDQLIDSLILLSARSTAPLIVGICPASPDNDREEFYQQMTEWISSRLSSLPGIWLITDSEMLSAYQVSDCFDIERDRVAHVPFTANFFAALGGIIARKVYAIKNPPYKVVVLDCDQTLWKGVCGEDGPQGIEIDAGRKVLQQFLIDQHNRGMLLAICSKNNVEDVQEVFQLRTDMPLKWQHFVSSRINWNAKSENLRSLAAELNLGLDSFIFIDDDPVICAEVEANCPEVLTLQLPPLSETIPTFLKSIWAFDRLVITEEDKQRTALYKESLAREQVRRSSLTFADFLDQLGLLVEIDQLESTQLARAAQLTQRTNQFNLTTLRRTERELKELTDQQEWHCLTVKVKDRFGDYGLVGLVIFQIVAQRMVVDTLLLSCRVLGRGVEHKLLNHLNLIAEQRSLEQIEITYIPTKKNRPALEFLESLAVTGTSSSDGKLQIILPVGFKAEIQFAVLPSAIDDDQGSKSIIQLSSNGNGRAQRLKRIATDLYDINQVITAIEAADRQARPELKQKFVAPRNPVEEMLAGLWSQLLKVEQVGIYDNFFELGGHSLLATQLFSRLRNIFNVDLPLQVLFDTHNIAELAVAIDQAIQAGHSLQSPPIVPIAREARLPLSFAQERLWFLDQFDPDSPSYNIPMAIRLTGPLNLKALQDSFNEIVSRHESLRTRFELDEGQPVQVIMPPYELELKIIDLQSYAEHERELKAQELGLALARQPFKLSQCPLLRAELLKLADEEQILFFVMHHIISDGWSMGLFIGELSLLYNAFAQGKPSPLADLSLQYADFAYWQREWLQGEVLATQIDYWKRQLAGITNLQLPTDYPRPAAQTFRGARQRITLSKELLDKLHALSTRNGATLSMTLLAAFQTLLYRYTGDKQIAVGSPIANRNRTEIEPLIGFFVNTLVMQTDLAGNPSFEELLKRVRAVSLGAYAHQDLPFEKLVEEIQPERDMSRSPLFQVMFVLQNTPLELPQPADLKLSGVAIDSATTKFDLILTMAETETGLMEIIDYNTDLFHPDTIKRMLGHYQVLLSSIVEHPSCPINELSLLSSSEAEQLLKVWNNTVCPLPAQETIYQLFESQVEQNAHQVAVEFGDEKLTYLELNHRANKLAHHLRSLGVEKESLVALCLERSEWMMVALLGIMKAGGAYIPLDPAYPPERLAFMLEDAQPKVLLTQQSLLPLLSAENAIVVAIDRDWPAIAAYSDKNLNIEINGDNLAYVIYTSGSTGKPKGVQIAHQGVVNFLQSMSKEPGLKATDRLLAVTTLSFDIAGLELYLPLTVGASLIIASREDAVDGQRLIELLDGMTVMQATPATWRMVIEAGWKGKADLKVLCGGEALPKQLAEQLLSRCEELWNLYGPTETTIWSTLQKVAPEQAISIGKPIDNTEIYILDNSLELVAVGIVGELYIGGSGLARGYLKREALTAEKFIDNPFKAGARIYRTGDLARYKADGSIEYLGRIDHQVKLRGYRIELGEIEAHLGKYEALKESVVVIREDEPGDKRLVAYLVSKQEPAPTAIDLRSYLKEHLPEYMIPATYVVLEQLPLTANGKIDRRALPAPPHGLRLSESEQHMARTATEDIIAGIWANILGFERVGINERFFDLGGHSLLIIQVLARLREAFKVELPVRVLFEHQTVAELAQAVEQAVLKDQGLLSPPIVTISRDQALPLSFSQQRLWFLDQLQPGNSAWNVIAAVRLQGQLNIEVLKQAINGVVARHETLRTTFPSVDGQPVQIIAAQLDLDLPVLSLLDMPEKDRETHAMATILKAFEEPFDIATGPLMRIMLIQVKEDEYLTVLINHHIISDGWSMGLLVREISVLYEAYLTGQMITGQTSNLPPLPIQYADFAHWQRQWLQGEVLNQQINFWKAKLAKAPLLQLPTDHPRPAVQTANGSSQKITLSNDIFEGLQTLNKKQGVTMFMTLLAAFKVLLYRYSGQSDVVVGAAMANRNRIELEGLIGFLVNTLVLRSDLSTDPQFEELLAAVRETTLAAIMHQDLPFEQLLEALKSELSRNLGNTPLFQVGFVFNRFSFEETNLTNLTISPVEIEYRRVNFDLLLIIVEQPQGLIISIDYNTDLYEATTIKRILNHYQNLLGSIVAEPTRRVTSLTMLAEAERRQLLYDWNSRTGAVPDKCLHQLFEIEAATHPDHLAVVFQKDQLTYQELNERANKLAHYLRGFGIGPDALVGFYLERSIDLIVAIMGILKAGAAYLPLDTTYPLDRIGFMLEDSAIPVLITQESLLDTLPTNWAQNICIDADWDMIERASASNPSHQVGLNNLAYLIYTSGSTGRPKAVCCPHKGALNLLADFQSRQPLSASDRGSLWTSFNFDVSVYEIFSALCAGATLYLPDEDVHATGPTFVRWLSEQAITSAYLPPFMLPDLLNYLEQGGAISLRRLLVGVEPISETLLSSISGKVPGLKIINGYGPTEAAICATLYDLSNQSTTPRTTPIGRPVHNTQIYLLDKNLAPVPIGVAGQLYISGDGLTRGYLKQPALTADRFVANPFSEQPGARMYNTGDNARYLGDGNIEFLGRVDHQVKVRGFRIELGEIESIVGQHARVRENVVIVREDQPGDKRLVAYLVAKEAGEQFATGEMRDFLKVKLPDYMVPSAFVTLEALPMTSNGKIDRRMLPKPDLGSSDKHGAATNRYIAPSGPIEKRLAAICSELLGIERMGVEDDFFELGGHSLLLTQLASQIRKEFQVEISLRQLFDVPNIAAMKKLILANQIEQEESPEVDDMLAKLEQLSTEEIRALLEAEEDDFV